MKIFVLTKRQYMGKDTIDELYGRLRFFPYELARQGHEVLGACLSYQPKPEQIFIDADPVSSRSVKWHSFNAGTIKPLGFFRYARETAALAESFRPDVIIAFSDTFYAIFGVWLAKRLNIKCVVDMYDNFEYFASARIPGMLALYHDAVRKANGVTTTSETLKERVLEKFPPQGPVQSFESGTDLAVFHPRPRTECRVRMNLPDKGPIIGYAGAIHSNRGIGLLFQAFDRVRSRNKDCRLALAGPLEKGLKIPDDEKIVYLGQLPWNDVPVFLNACDVTVIIHKDTLFGRYCFPQKTYEIAACRIPFVASRVGAMEQFLKSDPDLLFDNDDPDSLVEALEKQLAHPRLPDIRIRTWEDIGGELSMFLNEL